MENFATPLSIYISVADLGAGVWSDGIRLVVRGHFSLSTTNIKVTPAASPARGFREIGRYGTP